MPLLNIRQEIEVFIVFVLSAVAFTDRTGCFDEANFADSFDHFEAKLVLDAKP